MDGGSKKIKEFKQETVDEKSKKKKALPHYPAEGRFVPSHAQALHANLYTVQ